MDAAGVPHLPSRCDARAETVFDTAAIDDRRPLGRRQILDRHADRLEHRRAPSGTRCARRPGSRPVRHGSWHPTAARRPTPASRPRGCRRSPCSARIAASSSSRPFGPAQPIALTCAPGLSQAPARTGVVAAVAVTTTSASRTAASAVHGHRADLGREPLGMLGVRLQTRTSAKSRTRRSASTWLRACTPLPRIASTLRIRPRQGAGRHGGDGGRPQLGDQPPVHHRQRARRSRAETARSAQDGSAGPASALPG